jgi:uncharacterized repeat protein (TIGR03803 family)
MHSKHAPLCGATATALAVAFVSSSSSSLPSAHAAYSLTAVYNFKSNQTVSPDGGGPRGGVGLGSDGLLYGTTFRGGATASGPLGSTFETGIVYDFDPVSKTYTALGNLDGSGGSAPNSWSNLIPDAAGNMYGTTQAGGSNGQGSIFMISAATHTPSTLYSMTLSTGPNSHGGLVSDGAGNLYGATASGIYSFNLASKVFTMLGTFPSSAGQDSYGNLYRDSAGNLYGTNAAFGANGYGAIFKWSATTHQIATLFAFSGTNGGAPKGGLVADGSGNLYGLTSGSGINAVGTVFEIDPISGNLTTLDNLGSPTTPVIDAAGNLYADAFGSIVEFDAATHTPTTLVSFSGTGFQQVSGSFYLDSHGDIFGTAFSGGTNSAGVIFEASPVPEPAAGIAMVMLTCPALLRRRRA